MTCIHFSQSRQYLHLLDILVLLGEHCGSGKSLSSWTGFLVIVHVEFGVTAIATHNFLRSMLVLEIIIHNSLVDVVDASNELIPVPIALMNYRVNGVFVNQGVAKTQLTLFRRFFLVDLVASQSSSGGSPTVMRFAQQIRFK